MIINELVECNLEPGGIVGWILLYIFGYIFDGFVFVRFHFFPINNRCRVGGADENVVELMFGEALHHVGLVDEAERLFELALHAHFLHQAAFGGIFERLAVTRMAAASVGPQPRGVVFGERTLLEQHLPFAIENEDRKGTMQRRVDVSSLLLHQSDGVIVGID